MSFLLILVVAVLNLIPANVTTFTVQVDEKETIRFTKQSDGGWQSDGTGDAAKLPNDNVPTLYVEGTKLTMKGAGNEQTLDLATMLGVTKDTDWKNLKEFKIGGAPVPVERKEDGLDFTLASMVGGSEGKQTVKVRWDVQERK